MYVGTLGQANGGPPANEGKPATTSDIQAEAGEMSTAQKIEAAADIAEASGKFAESAGPLVGMAATAFGQVAAGAPQMFAPAMQGLLALPLPQPIKDQIKAILQNTKKNEPGPKPKTPPANKKALEEAAAAAYRRKMIPWVVGGVGVVGLGLVAFFTIRKKRK